MQRPWVLALAAGVIVLLVALALPLLRMGGGAGGLAGDEAAPGTGLPWQVSRLAEGRAQVFGLEPGLLPRLFERGARGRIQRHVPGHGLGLYIVRRVMELHDGSAELVRNGPDGATMRLMVGQAALQ